jgi:hypothetical protein
MMLLDLRGISGAAIADMETVSSGIAVELRMECDVKSRDDVDTEEATGMLTFANTENSDAGR